MASTPVPAPVEIAPSSVAEVPTLTAPAPVVRASMPVVSELIAPVEVTVIEPVPESRALMPMVPEPVSVVMFPLAATDRVPPLALASMPTPPVESTVELVVTMTPESRVFVPVS